MRPWKEEAEKREIGAETLARQILTDYATTAKIRSIDDRYAALVKDVTQMYKQDRENLMQIIDENHMIMEELMKLIEK